MGGGWDFGNQIDLNELRHPPASRALTEKSWFFQRKNKKTASPGREAARGNLQRRVSKCIRSCTEPKARVVAMIRRATTTKARPFRSDTTATPIRLERFAYCYNAREAARVQ
jgi:hypothetical protein